MSRQQSKRYRGSKTPSEMNKPYVHTCDSCGNPITGDKVRISVSPPNKSWIALVFHDLVCMLDFFTLEADVKDPKSNRVFTEEDGIECEQLSLEDTPQGATL